MNVTNPDAISPPQSAVSNGGVVRRVWHAIGPTWIRELRLAALRCRQLLPRRTARWSFLGWALPSHLLGRRESFALKSPRLKMPVVVRPFSSDLAVAVEMFVADDYREVRERAGMPKTVLDLGANVGLSVRLWQDWYPGVGIVAVEPNPQSAAVARQNISAGPRPNNVTLVEAAIGPVAGTVHLSVGDEPWMHTTVNRPSASTLAVRCVTVLDCLALIDPAERFDLCKCDIEGGEADLFRDCRGWIERVGVLVIETHDPYDLNALQKDLERNGSGLKLCDFTQRGGHAVAYFDREAAGTSPISVRSSEAV